MPRQLADLGDESYDAHEFGTPWWLQRAKSPAHRRAYQAIAATAARHCPRPTLAVDYACGPGLLLAELARSLPRTRLVGLDESRAALDGARAYLATRGARLPDPQRLELQQAVLPLGAPKLPKADLLVFSFPDFRGACTPAVMRQLKEAWPADWQASKALRRQLRQDREEHHCRPNAASETFFKRMAARHYHGLLKKGGIAIRVEYAQCQRGDCDPTLLAEMDWIDGVCSAPKAYEGKRSGLRLFDLVDSHYQRSDAVMKDVYHQTNDPDDRRGGYLIGVFKKR